MRGWLVVTVRYYAAARAAAGVAAEEVAAGTLADLRSLLSARHGPALAQVLSVSSVLLPDGTRLPDEATLPAGAVVEVLPPFAGG